MSTSTTRRELASPVAVAYPFDLVHDVSCREGVGAVVRPIRPDDGPGLRRFHRHLSRRTTYLRFFGVHPELSSQEVDRFTHVDYQDRLALVAEVDDELVAVGRYDRTPHSTEAEVAFVVADAYQHHGLGTCLLDDLAAAAWQRGITTFTAMTLTENRTMRDVFRASGFPVASRLDRETVFLRFPIDPRERAVSSTATPTGRRPPRRAPCEGGTVSHRC